MSRFNLPAGTEEFLGGGRQFEYDSRSIEPGFVKLKALDDLKDGEVWIATDFPGDPHDGENGYYSVPAVSLTGECEAYDPEYILLWLPNERLFGTWDCDHWILKTFPGASWSDITANPAPYLSAQWGDSGSVSTDFVPWPHYAFKAGRPF